MIALKNNICYLNVFGFVRTFEKGHHLRPKLEMKRDQQRSRMTSTKTNTWNGISYNTDFYRLLHDMFIQHIYLHTISTADWINIQTLVESVVLPLEVLTYWYGR